MYPYTREPPMTIEFADYVAQQDARNTIQLNVRKWTMMLCDALEHNFTEYKVVPTNGLPILQIVLRRKHTMI